MPLSPDRSHEHDPPRPRRVRSERGATLVEYTLLVGLFALGTVGALSLLQDGAQATAQSSADRISTHSIPTTTTP
ncbi:MAG: Flp family type IVb pilin [Actinomycetota bacterium]|nr:Flp family type IVb pilin [Actinomycetota bacterium]